MSHFYLNPNNVTVLDAGTYEIRVNVDGIDCFFTVKLKNFNPFLLDSEDENERKKAKKAKEFVESTFTTVPKIRIKLADLAIRHGDEVDLEVHGKPLRNLLTDNKYSK